MSNLSGLTPGVLNATVTVAGVSSGAAVQVATVHGPLNFTNVFTTGNQNILHTDPPASLTIAAARIPDASPRP